MDSEKVSLCIDMALCGGAKVFPENEHLVFWSPGRGSSDKTAFAVFSIVWKEQAGAESQSFCRGPFRVEVPDYLICGNLRFYLTLAGRDPKVSAVALKPWKNRAMTLPAWPVMKSKNQLEWLALEMIPGDSLAVWLPDNLGLLPGNGSSGPLGSLIGDLDLARVDAQVCYDAQSAYGGRLIELWCRSFEDCVDRSLVGGGVPGRKKYM